MRPLNFRSVTFNDHLKPGIGSLLHLNLDVQMRNLLFQIGSEFEYDVYPALEESIR